MKQKEIFNKKEKKEIDKILKTNNFKKICKLLQFVLKIGSQREIKQKKINMKFLTVFIILIGLVFLTQIIFYQVSTFFKNVKKDVDFEKK